MCSPSLPILGLGLLAALPGPCPAQQLRALGPAGARPGAAVHAPEAVAGPAAVTQRRVVWMASPPPARDSTFSPPRRPRRIWLRAAGIGALAAGATAGVVVSTQGRQCGFEGNDSCAGWAVLAAGAGGVIGGVAGGLAGGVVDLWRHARWERAVQRAGVAPSGAP